MFAKDVIVLMGRGGGGGFQIMTVGRGSLAVEKINENKGSA